MRRTGPEKRFWKRVRLEWRGHACRVEASLGGCDPGTPDTSLGWAGKNMWVELKVWPDPLSAEQIVWHTDCTQRGGGARVLCELPNGNVWLTGYSIYMNAVRASSRPTGNSLQGVLKFLMQVLEAKSR